MKHAFVFALTLFAGSAHAADDLWQVAGTNPLLVQECGSCHMAFPPALLSRQNWNQIIDSLDKHFGDDATLEPQTRDAIAGFLEDHAARGRTADFSSESLRMTDTPWFLRMHHGALRLLAKGKVKSLGDCLLCHKGPSAGGEAPRP